jgi:hypothetical protein
MGSVKPRRLLSLCILAILMLIGGCLPAPATGSGAGTRTADGKGLVAAAPVASASPALPLQFPSLFLRPGPQAGDWQVMGTVTNQSSLTLQSLELRVSLYDAANHLLAQLNTRAMQSPLAPGQESPFQVSFGAAPSADHASVTAAGFEQAASPPQIQIEALHVLTTPEGDELALGWLVNRGQTAVTIEGLQALVRDATGLPYLLQPSLAGPDYIEAGARMPFAIRIPALDPAGTYQVCFTSRLAETRTGPSVALPSPPRLTTDTQGNVIVAGLFKNVDQHAHSPDVLISLLLGDELVGVAQLAPPLPLGPDEELGFAASDFPGLSSRLENEPTALKRLVLHADIMPAPLEENTAELVPLQVELLRFEAVGSSLFLQGTVQSTGSGRLIDPAVMVTMRDEAGAVVSGAWSRLASGMPESGPLDFRLVLLLPAGENPSMSEYDLRAAARKP